MNLVARIHEIGPLLRENAVLADQQRFPADARITALQEAGAFSVSALARYGGYEGGARMLFEVARAISYHDPAAGWITVISNGSVMLANRLPDTTLERVFGDRTRPGEARDHGTPRMASILSSPRALAVPDGDGYRISGEWPYASNVHHSEWALVMVQPPGAAAASDAPALASAADSSSGQDSSGKEGTRGKSGARGFALLHTDQWSIRNSWFTIGMRGTGSDTLVAEDAWVPADQVVPWERVMGPAYESDPGTTAGQRLAPMVTMATTIAAPSLGGAEAARDYVRDQAHQRGVSFTVYDRQVRSGAFVKDVGHAALKIETAAMHLQRSADTIDSHASGFEPMPVPLRAECRGRIGNAAYELAEAMNDLMWAHGTSAFAESSLLGRMWRDVNTGVRHGATAAPFTLELYGDALLGIDYISTKI
jgi:alkylation response protein AidB-like acyl-CoA dehydrogenase